MNHIQAENQKLRERVEELEETVRQLREQLVPLDPRVRKEWRLTKSQAHIFLHMTTRDVVTRDSINAALYSDRAGDYPHSNVIGAHIHGIRRKLEPFGIVIQTVNCIGWSLQDRHQFASGGEA